jgi:hypothetical protein
MPRDSTRTTITALADAALDYLVVLEDQGDGSYERKKIAADNLATELVSAAGALIDTNNLSDLDDASTARTNLDVDSSSEVDSKIDADIATHNALTSGAHGLPDTSTLLVDGDIGSTVQAYDADTVKTDLANTFTASPQTVTSSSTSSTRGIISEQTSTNAAGAVMQFKKSRAEGSVASGDFTGLFVAQNHDGASFLRNGNFGYYALTKNGTGDISGYWFIAARTSDDSNPVNNNTIGLVVTSDKRVGIAKTNPLHPLDIAGDAMLSGVLYLGTYTVSTLPTATVRGFIFVSDETGGATTAFSDGTNWRRSQDRAIVS